LNITPKDKFKVLVIAEIGVNHNGSLTLAKELVDQAKECGADVAKFQTFNAERLVTETASKAQYQIENTNSGGSQFEMLKSLELREQEFEDLFNYCSSKKIEFLSTPFDKEDLIFLNNLGMKRIKIPSGEITNPFLLEEAGKSRKEVILSTGMANLKEIREALNLLIKNGCSKQEVTILHCNTEYPTPLEDVNLNAMNTIRDEFKVKVGYSDHTSGIEVPIAAVSMGASIIEKHFTLDKKMDGPDHLASLNPQEFSLMAKGIRSIETALGSREKNPSKSEKKNILIARRSIVAFRDITKGEKFSLENICFKRPGGGINPMHFETLLGKEAKKNYSRDELIEA